MIDKSKVYDFWNDASCGEELYLEGRDKIAFEKQAQKRYELEPYIKEFAEFEASRDQRVLEIGVGLGADHQKFIEAGANVCGIDLTERAIENTKTRLKLFGLESSLRVGDAEKLEFDDNSFEIVYSWGVIHHSPNTQKAINEIYRVLAPGGVGKIMIYHKWSLIGLMLWLRYGLFKLKPFTSLKTIYSKYLESPGTKAYSKNEAEKLFSNFSVVDIKTVLTHGGLLQSEAGQRHKGLLIEIARKIWPRKLIQSLLPSAGLFMLIKVIK